MTALRSFETSRRKTTPFESWSYSSVWQCAPRVLAAISFVVAVFLFPDGSQCQSRLASRQPGTRQNERITQLGNQTEENRIRLRIVWGGGASTAWQGKIVLSDGRFEHVSILGLEPDAGAALQVSGNELQIRQIRTSEFSGLDIDVAGPLGNELTLTLAAPELGIGIQDRVIDLTPLLLPEIHSSGIQIALDDSGNRLNINRAPGDRLPVTFARDHLVFDPGEAFEFNLRPFRGTSETGAKARLELEVIATGESRSVFDEHYPLTWDGSRYFLDQAIRLEVPQQEGAYDIRLTLRYESLANRLTLNRQSLTSAMQIVVVERAIDRQTVAAEDIVLWKEIYNSEDVRNQWLDKIPGVPRFRLASSGSENKTIENQGVAPGMVDGKTWNEFAPGGWQAVPIQIEDLGKPHIVEIEYLDDGPLAMGISVIQPDASGQIGAFGVDSGISIPQRRGHQDPKTGRHRIFFWPTHERPYVLFANRHASRSARIGAIRVLAGPDRLAANDFEGQDPVDVLQDVAHRRYMSFFEKPLFAENFSANKSFDEETGQSWHDWNSFLVGANRWTQYLKANGYTSAMLVVAGDGSALYPSPLIQPTPDYDSGVFSSRGLDPVRKDVVEMLFRVFKREGLQLVPVFHFNSPLVDLERQRLSGTALADGITLVDLQGDTRLATLRDSVSPVSVYNPLDQRVQRAYTAVVREFVDRYSEGHPSIHGIGFLYSQDAIQVLPGQTWGVDRTTLERFRNDVGVVDTQPSDWFVNMLNNEGRSTWLDWRKSEMAAWLDELQQATSPIHRMYLMAGDMFETQDAFSALAPSLRPHSDMADALDRLAFPADRIANDSRMVFLHPHESAPEKSLADNRLNIQLNDTADSLQLFRSFANGGTLFSHRCSWAEFEQLRHYKLFGKEQLQPLLRLQPLSMAGSWNRQRLAQSIADHDSQVLVEGGWLTGLGQEEHVAELVEIFTQLPDIRFNDVTTNGEAHSPSGVVVRQAVAANRNWFYAVNPTPWRLKCRIRFSGRTTVVESLGAAFSFESVEQPEIAIELEPFSIQAGHTDPSVSVTDYQVDLPQSVSSELQDRLNSLLTKVSRAAQIAPVKVLFNSGFEPTAPSDEDAHQFGWSFDHRDNEAITLNQEDAFAGETALTMVSRGNPTWIRSNEFAPPVTGRLSVSVMIRMDDPATQPPLRISIQGDDGRHVYYRYGRVGGDSHQITTEWQKFAVHFDDLPLSSNKGNLKIGFDLMGTGQVDLDQVRVYDRWLDGQDSRTLIQLLGLAGFQLTNKQNMDRCRRILDGYWPRFLEEFFPDPATGDAISDEREPANATRSSQWPVDATDTPSPKR